MGRDKHWFAEEPVIKDFQSPGRFYPSGQREAMESVTQIIKPLGFFLGRKVSSIMQERPQHANLQPRTII